MCLTCTKTISSELLIKKKSATCFTKKEKQMFIAIEVELGSEEFSL